MGISMAIIQLMERYGLLAAGRNVLDLGSSNLYGATAEDITAFVRRHNPNPRADLDPWAQRLAAGSGADASGQALNKSFVGEMLEASGMGYDAIDIAIGHKTTIVDLNTKRLPEHMIGAYDTVLNCGTSEHILNQMNVFAALHAATKKGGMIMHLVPSMGFVDHGYFCYTSRFFFDLAGYNKYEVVDMWYDGPSGSENVFATARQYQTYFPGPDEASRHDRPRGARDCSRRHENPDDFHRAGFPQEKQRPVHGHGRDQHQRRLCAFRRARQLPGMMFVAPH